MKHSLFYFLGHIISRGQSFFLVPLLVRFLNKEVLGVFEVLSSLNIFILTLAVFSLDACLVSFYNEQKDDRKKSEIFCATIFLSFIIGLIVFVVSFCIKETLLKFLLLEGKVSSEYFLMSIAGGVFNGWTHLFLVLFRLRFESFRFSFVTIMSPLLLLGFTYFLLRQVPNLESVVYGNIFSSILTFVICFLFSNKSFLWVAPSFKCWMPRFYKIILPLIPFSFSAWILNLADREILVKLRGFSEAGVYGVLSKISNLTGVLLGPFQISWSPYAMASWERKVDARQTFLNIFKYFFLSSFVIVFLIFISSDYLIKIFSNSSYLEFSYLLAPLSICNVLGVGYYFPLVSFLKEKKMLGSTVAFSVGALFNVFFNFMLIPGFGILGAVIANLIGYCSMFLVAGYFERSLTGIGYFYKRIVFFSLLISFLIIFAGKSYFNLILFERIWFVFCLSAFFVGFIYFFSDKTRNEIEFLYLFFKSKISSRSKLP